MYHAHRKSGTSVGDKITQMNCFVEKTKSWFWTIIILVVGAVVYAIVTSSGRTPAYSAAGQSFRQGGQFQNTALTQCPYCPGFLDSQGRCNVRECPIYSPNWGRTSTSPRSIPVRRVLIKELALEVGASEGKGSVIIQSVYVGGNAEKAGLRIGDRIVRFNGRNIKKVQQFKSTVTRAKPEANVKIQVIRNKKKIKSIVMIGEGEMEGVTAPTTQG
jgi:membrane-associated protease RseP (regulator of RpoE activity)